MCGIDVEHGYITPQVLTVLNLPYSLTYLLIIYLDDTDRGQWKPSEVLHQ